MRSLLLIALSLTLISSTTAVRQQSPDPACATGKRSGEACCPKACNTCGGKKCAFLSELLRTDCCPTSITAGTRVCSRKPPPCKLVPADLPRTKCPRHIPRTFIAAAPTKAGLRNVVRNFRQGVRKRAELRVINWEGSAPFVLPNGYYNKSGVLFESKGDYHAVSNAPGTLDDKFSSYLPEIITQNFQTYSGERLFAPIMDNKLTVRFVKQGKGAKVGAFGAVFVDVEKKASLKLFDTEGCLIERVKVPRMPGGLSFVGVLAKGIARVEMELGTISLSRFASIYRDVPVGDVVVLDDFVYARPY